MLITSHFLATTALLVGAKSLGLHLDHGVTTACYALGVGIDLDHIIFHPKKAVHVSRLALNKIKTGTLTELKFGIKLHTALQETIALPFFFLLAFLGRHYLGFNNSIYLPVICLALHILMDGLYYDKQLFWPLSKRIHRSTFNQNVSGELLVFILVGILFVIFAL